MLSSATSIQDRAGRQQGQGLGKAALEAAMSHCSSWSGGWLGLRTGRGRVGDTKGGWWLLSKGGQLLQEMPQTITASVFNCVQLGWSKTKMGIPRRLGWVFLRTGGTLRLHWNDSVPEQPKLNGNRHTWAGRLPYPRTLSNSVTADPKPLCSC